MTINMDDINNNPITGEEIAALVIGGQEINKQLAANLAEQFKSYLTDKAKQDGVAQAELINIQTKAFQEVKEEMAELKMLVQKNSRPTVTISYSTANALQWKKEISNTIETIRLRLNISRPEAYGKVYDRIKEKYGTDVRALHEMNKDSYESIISMCAFNDGLRAKFDSSLNDIYTSVRYEYADAMKMPENIRRDCLAIAPNKPVNVTFKKILKKMGEVSSIDINAYIFKNTSTTKYARCTKSYFVSKDSILFAAYKRAVAELMNSEV